MSSASGRANRSGTWCSSGGMGGRTRGRWMAGMSGCRPGAGAAGDVGGGERLATRGAPEALLEVVATRLVHEHGGRAAVTGEVTVAPVHERDEDGGELDAHRRQ